MAADGVRVFLIDGTYELFRQFHGRPSQLGADGQEVAAVRGAVGSTLALVEQGGRHIGVATDHVIESFRNDLWASYKTGEGIQPELKSQFPLLEEALAAAGFAVWPMVDLEADDALAAAAVQAAADDEVEQVAILTPDKDLAQCVVGQRVVQVDRRNNVVLDEAAVEAKYGVPPESIPDWLALVGDSADGYPGLPGWGAKSAAAVLRAHRFIENIPDNRGEWLVSVRGSAALASTLADHRTEAMLFKDLATLRVDDFLFGELDDLKWNGPTPAFAEICERLAAPGLLARAQRLATS